MMFKEFEFKHPNTSVDVWRFVGSRGENTVRPGHQYQLAERKEKDCDRQPNQYASVRHMNEGRYGWNAKGVDPDVHHTGRVPVVV